MIWEEYRSTETPVQFDRRLADATRIGRELESELQNSPEAVEIRMTVEAVGKAGYYDPALGVDWSGRFADDYTMRASWSWIYTPGKQERVTGKTPAELLAAVRAEVRRQGMHLRSIRGTVTAIDNAHTAAEKAAKALRVVVGLNPERQDFAESLRLAEEALDRLSKIKKETLHAVARP